MDGYIFVVFPQELTQNKETKGHTFPHLPTKNSKKDFAVCH